jgi:uncharacterized protein
MNLAYTYRFDHRGRSAEAGDERHIRDLIEQVLFTAPGERVMNPTFGSGVAQLVFAPNSVELAGATQMLLQTALQRWLGELITLQSVSVDADDASLNITVQYAIRGTDQLQVQTFQRPIGGGS